MSFESPLTLGIETSCDDTACAVVDRTGQVLASVVSSQLSQHRPYGGVVPEIASREHLCNWPMVSSEALGAAGVDWSDFGAVAATRGPGLVGSLLVGLSLGRAIAWGLSLPFHGIHHIEGHLFSPFLSVDGQPATPVPENFDGLVVSGGHTSLLEVRRGEVCSLIETRDDAMGETFDKVGKRLGLEYPQGPKVDQLAELGDPEGFRPTIPRIKEDLFFSYSGLKTQALRAIEHLEKTTGLDVSRIRSGEDELPEAALDLLAGFRRAAVGQIMSRLESRHKSHPFQTLAVSGGVAANRLLRRELTQWAERLGIDLRLVPLKFSGDNAAMIAFAALERIKRGVPADPSDVVVASRIPFANASQ